jgi:hypothetical protein
MASLTIEWARMNDDRNVRNFAANRTFFDARTQPSQRAFQIGRSLSGRGDQVTLKGAESTRATSDRLSSVFRGVAMLALLVVAFSGCESSSSKSSPPAPAPAPAVAEKAADPPKERSPAINLDAYPVEPISIEDFFKDKTSPAKYLGKRVTWRCVVESVGAFDEHRPGFSATGYPVEFQGLKEPPEDKQHLAEYSKRYSAYAQAEMARVARTVTCFFDDRASYDKLKNAKDKRASITGLVAESPINGSADLKHCRVLSVD